jgi:hypothetical protein
MNRASLSRTSLVVLLGAVLGAIALIELGGIAGGRGALLVTLVLWTGIAQGSVAVVAATDLTSAKWAASVKRELLGAAQLLPFLAVLFLLLWPQRDLFPWGATPGRWLNRPFFFTRNVAVLLATAGMAQLFARRSLRGGEGAKRHAVVYLLLFVVSQTLVAFDWVMSLSYPWVSSMFGMFFMVEALYAGLAASGLVFLLLDRQRRSLHPGAWPRALQDLGRLQFGFSVLWGGLFFAQFMLIWYGNIPEEVGFIAQRVAVSPTRQLSVLFLAACFGVPFFVLLTAAAKRSVRVVGAVSSSILLGLLAEKLLFMLPALSLHFGVLLVENVLLAVVWLATTLRAAGAAEGEA